MAKALRRKRSLTPNPYYNRGNGGGYPLYLNILTISLSPPTSWLHLIPANAEVKFSYLSLKLGLLKVGKGDSEEVHFTED